MADCQSCEKGNSSTAVATAICLNIYSEEELVELPKLEIIALEDGPIQS